MQSKLHTEVFTVITSGRKTLLRECVVDLIFSYVYFYVGILKIKLYLNFHSKFISQMRDKENSNTCWPMITKALSVLV